MILFPRNVQTQYAIAIVYCEVGDIYNHLFMIANCKWLKLF